MVLYSILLYCRRSYSTLQYDTIQNTSFIRDAAPVGPQKWLACVHCVVELVCSWYCSWYGSLFVACIVAFIIACIVARPAEVRRLCCIGRRCVQVVCSYKTRQYNTRGCVQVVCGYNTIDVTIQYNTATMQALQGNMGGLHPRRRARWAT